MKKQLPEWRPTDGPLIPSRPKTYNEECAATGGRSYQLAKKQEPAAEVEDDE